MHFKVQAAVMPQAESNRPLIFQPVNIPQLKRERNLYGDQMLLHLVLMGILWHLNKLSL